MGSASVQFRQNDLASRAASTDDLPAERIAAIMRWGVNGFPKTNIFIFVLGVHSGAVSGQTDLAPCSSDSGCEYPGCNEEMGLPALVACRGAPRHCQHTGDGFSYHACAPPPPWWVAPPPPPGWVAPGSDPAACLCPAMAGGMMTCASTVRQVADFPRMQNELGACIDSLMSDGAVAESDALSLHCLDECGGDNAQDDPTAREPEIWTPRKSSAVRGAFSPPAVLLVSIAASSLGASLW